MSTEPKQCLLCGSAQSTRFKYRSNLSPEGEVCRLYHEIQDPDILVTGIIPAQRAYLLRRINDYRGSVARLPTEVLSEIFEHACWLSKLALTMFGQRGSDHFQVVLAGVSSRWRRIIHSSPLLWANLSLTFSEYGWTHLYNRINLLGLYLEHSGSVLLDLKFAFSTREDPNRPRPPWPKPSTLIHGTIDNTLLDNFHRIRLLHLDKASPRWIAATPKLTQLESFSFSYSQPLDYGLSILSFPNTKHLRELTVVSWPLIDVKSSGWASLAILILESIGINVCVGLLAECTNLVEFRCRSPILEASESSLRLGQPWKTRVTREYLRTFEWSTMPRTGHPSRIELSMFQYIHMPALQFLKLSINRHSQHNALRVFCKRLPTTISTLHLSMICDDTEALDHCLFKHIAADCVVTDMTLCSSSGSINFLAHAFSWLEDPTHFPKLRRMIIDDTIRSTGRNLVLPPNFAKLIHKMIAPRVPPLSGFHMKFPWITVDWPPDTRDALWELVNKHGLRLNIQEDRNLFNFLPRMSG